MTIPRIALSMRYIDDKFITDSISYRNGSVKFFWLKIAGCAACAALMLTLAITLPFNLISYHATDSYTEGIRVEISDLRAFSKDYGKSVLAELADFLESDESLSYSVNLWYYEDGAADNLETWNNLTISAKSDDYSFTIHSFFNGDIEKHKVSSVFTKKNTRVVNINDTTVLIAPHPLSGQPITEWDFWDYAIFEHDNVVYDVRVLSNNQSATMDLLYKIIPRLDNE